MQRIRAMMVLATMAGATLVAEAGAQSLRGSRSSVDLMYYRAVAYDLDFFRTGNSVTEAVVDGDLVALSITSDVFLQRVSYPYVLPATRTFVNSLAARYRTACGERLIVTSAARPAAEQPRNASPKSVHPTGMAVDFRRPTGKCLEWLRKELVALEKRGEIEATEERRPPHFHVAVLRRPSRQIASSRPAGASRVTESNGDAEPAPKATPASRTVSASGRYTVKKGDTLSEIAQAHGITTARLRSLNGLKTTRIRVGQTLKVR